MQLCRGIFKIILHYFVQILKEVCGIVNSFTRVCKSVDALHFRKYQLPEHSMLLGLLIAFRTENYTSNFVSVCSMTNSLSEINYVTCGIRKYCSIGDTSDSDLLLVLHSSLTTSQKFT